MYKTADERLENRSSKNYSENAGTFCKRIKGTKGKKYQAGKREEKISTGDNSSKGYSMWMREGAPRLQPDLQGY